MFKRFIIVFLLGFSSGVPLALVSSTLQAWFADAGMSVVATGCLSLLGFPYVYRFLWAPILDRYSLWPSFGKRRSWMLATQVLLIVGFNLLAWCSPETSPSLIAILAFILASLSATQDTVIDAHRTEYLHEKEFGLGASLAMSGYRIAMLITGGLALVVASTWGWALTYRLMGALMSFGILATCWSPEPSRFSPPSHSFRDIFWGPFKSLLQKPGIWVLCGFIISYKLAESFTTTTSGIVMPFLIQEMKFSLATIGYVNKVLGVVAIVLGGLFAGLILLRWSLFRALFVFGLLQALTNALFIKLALNGQSLMWLSIAVASDNFAAGMGSTALVALLMRFVDKHFTATQFSMLVALAMLPRVLSGPIGAYLQSHFGWVGLFQIGFLSAFLFIPFLWRLRKYIHMSL